MHTANISTSSQEKFHVQEHTNGDVSSRTASEVNSANEKPQKEEHKSISQSHDTVRSPPIQQEVSAHDYEMSQIKKRRELKKQRDLEVKEMVLEAERQLSRQLNDTKDRK